MGNLAPVVVASVVVAVVACADDLPVEANPADAPLLNASAPASMIQSASVHWLSDLSDAEGATAQLKRTKSGAAYSFRTTGLEKGHVVTMWWVIFNNPEECENPVPDLKLECNLPDLSNPDVEPSVMGGGGHLVGGSGRATLAGHLREGQITTFHPAFVGSPGLLDARGAEIHLVLRRHGPAIPGMVDEMRTNFEAACTPESSGGFGDGDNECANLQAAAFVAPSPQAGERPMTSSSPDAATESPGYPTPQVAIDPSDPENLAYVVGLHVGTDGGARGERDGAAGPLSRASRFERPPWKLCPEIREFNRPESRGNRA